MRLLLFWLLALAVAASACVMRHPLGPLALAVAIAAAAGNCAFAMLCFRRHVLSGRVDLIELALYAGILDLAEVSARFGNPADDDKYAVTPETRPRPSAAYCVQLGSAFLAVFFALATAAAWGLDRPAAMWWPFRAAIGFELLIWYNSILLSAVVAFHLERRGLTLQ